MLTDKMPTAAELLKFTWACPEWKEARDAGRLALAGELKAGTPFIGISGNRAVRSGFIKDDAALGCRNTNLDGTPGACCTFAVVAVEAGRCVKCGDTLTGHEDDSATHCRWCVTTIQSKESSKESL